ncbi:MAG: aldehyde dehydrogenase family protein [Thermodesulfobacteriota bacterium]|nr:aldehyde dehydrogenase family protein [Thermodesulfobacteriota bacterium]
MNGMVKDEIGNWIGGRELRARSGETFDKLNPVDGKLLCRVVRSGREEADAAVEAASEAHPAWAATTAVKRGSVLHDVAVALKDRREDMARMVSLETGKAYKEALGETDGAIALGLFFAGEGQRLYGRTSTSGVDNRMAMTLRCPVGVAGLIIAANTPIANVAWKVFPALICGNAAVLKAAEDTPGTAWLFGEIVRDAGLPPGTLNVLQGLGHEAGAALVENPGVELISFTGSTKVGRQIAEIAGRRLAKVSLELGGKNPLVVCDDADLDHAARWTVLSAFSNAGQRCAAAGRIIVFDSVYEEFKKILLEKTRKLKVGPTDQDDLGPVINERQLNNMLSFVEQSREQGAKVLVGGRRLDNAGYAGGFFMAPTVIENADPASAISRTELFGPITCLYRAAGFEQALEMANDSPYGLTACIHTKDVNRAMRFAGQVKAGMAVVNAGTYGSEPHMPFGGVKDSGNGSREPGTEALDFYSDLKNVLLSINPDKV